MEEPTMKESANNRNNFPAENQSALKDSSLPYELPELRKHGKVNSLTNWVLIPGSSFDNIFGPGREAIS
jgi:hypothetical protein